MVAPLCDKEHSGILQLEALRSPAEPGYLVAVYRQMSGLLPSDTVDPDQPEKKPASVCFWAQYDLIQSNLPTAENALEQVLAFLEMRCDQDPSRWGRAELRQVVLTTPDPFLRPAQEGARDLAAFEVSQQRAAYQVGEFMGRERLLNRGYNGIKFRQTDFVGLEAWGEYPPTGYPKGFDGVLQDTKGNYWIAEYKGGKGRLAKGQMERPWVVKRIIELQKAQNPWGNILRRALEDGKLRGIATETPFPSAQLGPGKTRVIKTWTY